MRSKLSVMAAIAILSVGAPGVGAPDRVIKGSLLAPDPDDVGRCVWLKQGDPSQGIVGHMIKISKRDVDSFRQFTLRVESGPLVEHGTTVTGPQFTVRFYGSRLGSCTAQPPFLSAVAGIRRSHRGMIPWGTRYALISMHEGARVSILGCYALLPWCIVWPESVALPSAAPQPFTFRIHR